MPCSRPGAAGDDVQARGVDVEHGDGSALPGQVSRLDGAKPTALAQRPSGLLPDSSTITEERWPSSRMRTTGERPEGRPGRNRLAGPGQARLPGDGDGVDGVGVQGQHVGRSHPRRDVAGAISTTRATATRMPAGGRLRARHPAEPEPGPAALGVGFVDGAEQGRGERLDAPDVVRPRPGRSGGRTAERNASVTPGSARRRSASTRAPVTRRDEQPVDAVADLLGKVPTVVASTGRPCLWASSTFCRRWPSVGQGHDVVLGQEPGDPIGGHVPRCRLDATRDARVVREVANGATGIPTTPPR